MDFLNNFIDDSSDWWDCATHDSSMKKNKNILISLHQNILSHYLLYERVIALYRDEPEIPDFVDDSKEVLLDYYNNPPVKLKDKLQNRRNNNLNVCPYCGDFVRPNTLDHFIPKDKFSHYAIFQNNLIPQCRKCASIKGDKYFDSSKGCLFIHPFYNDILSKLKFNIALSFDSSINSIKVERVTLESSNLNANDKLRVINQFSELQVNSRIKEYCLREFKELRRKAKRNKFSLDLLISGKLCISELNRSDWCSAFYESLDNCTEAKIFLNNLMPSAQSASHIPVSENIEEFGLE
ncbi:HNH endonuclease [Acinetobacter baumannii]|uniref:HNH endonuclease n=3 Tax=Acinetobacter baumannii TaxID=470 RepID=UPI0022AD4465|nr:HNH endonuclease [Acinetobacter baumannii]MDC4325732.1 HNH endonuclease [Acinetobacter baumannii]MDV7494247.1 HNH endonuclease [Acinetobacter baumannii]WNX70571.1 HNH endonuclease [Acinetobacter baumannii]HCV3156014.1 HNH endonuclease [Acinetobacter baumannii]